MWVSNIREQKDKSDKNEIPPPKHSFLLPLIVTPTGVLHIITVSLNAKLPHDQIVTYHFICCEILNTRYLTNKKQVYHTYFFTLQMTKIGLIYIKNGFPRNVAGSKDIPENQINHFFAISRLYFFCVVNYFLQIGIFCVIRFCDLEVSWKSKQAVWKNSRPNQAKWI